MDPRAQHLVSLMPVSSMAERLAIGCRGEVSVDPLPDRQSDLRLIRLPHPRTNELVYFMIRLSPGVEELMQVERIDGASSIYPKGASDSFPSRSLFIGDFVQRDGSLYLFSRFDPLFLLLPFLERSRSGDEPPRNQSERSTGRAELLENILFDPNLPELANIGKLPSLPRQLRNICDVVDDTPGFTFYRLNDAKVADWLEAKYDLFTHGLVTERNFKDEQKLEERRRLVFQIIADALPKSRQEALLTRLNLSQTPASVTTIATYADITPMAPSQTNKPRVPAKSAKGKNDKSVGVKKLATASTKGMSTLTTFFKKQ
ncbi:ribonuclease H2, subunit B [Zopfochytrium polystomum]|nr:ribonuclease H2, subunit B [Zopfochytrium polystomum]